MSRRCVHHLAKWATNGDLCRPCWRAAGCPRIVRKPVTRAQTAPGTTLTYEASGVVYEVIWDGRRI